MNDQTAELFGEIFKRNHETSADVAALKILVVCLLEQIPHDKRTLNLALTRHLDSLNEVMERDGVAEHIQKLHRERLDSLSRLALLE